MNLGVKGTFIYKMRKKIVVSKLQLSFIIATFGLIVGVSLTLIASVYFNVRYYLYSLPIAESIVKQISHDMILVIVAVASIIFIVSIFAVLIMSNKIYGPLWRFNQTLNKLAKGEEVEGFQIRKGDAIEGISQIPKIASLYANKTQQFDSYELLP